jgi:nucleoid DNA-binding protein
MTKSELIEILSQRQAHLKGDDVDLAVKALLEMMGGALSSGERIEIRGFGSFSCISVRRAWAATRRRVSRSRCRVNMFPISSRVRNCANASAA